MKRFFVLFFLFLILFPFTLPAWGGDRVPRVIVSLKPIHALVAGVMQGVAQPQLLLRGYTSPHAYVLRPSDIRSLHRADLLFWVGPELETFLVQAVENLPPSVERVTLITSEMIQTLPNRRGGLGDLSSHASLGAEASHQHGQEDPHIWLDPDNAKQIVRLAGRVLMRRFPTFAAKFQANVTWMLQRLQQLDQELKQQLLPVQDVAFLVYHDAYHYFVRHFGLRSLGAVTLNPDQPFGVRHLGNLRRFLGTSQATCLFTEPQFQTPMIQTLVEGHAIKVGVLDPLGAGVAEGVEHYFQWMKALAHNLTECLQ